MQAETRAVRLDRGPAALVEMAGLLGAAPACAFVGDSLLRQLGHERCAAGGGFEGRHEAQVRAVNVEDGVGSILESLEDLARNLVVTRIIEGRVHIEGEIPVSELSCICAVVDPDGDVRVLAWVQLDGWVAGGVAEAHGRYTTLALWWVEGATLQGASVHLGTGGCASSEPRRSAAWEDGELRHASQLIEEICLRSVSAGTLTGLSGEGERSVHAGQEGAREGSVRELSLQPRRAGYPACALCRNPAPLDRPLTGASHPQRHVTLAAGSACVDEELGVLLEVLGVADVQTMHSCQGGTGRAYISFADGRGLGAGCEVMGLDLAALRAGECCEIVLEEGGARPVLRFPASEIAALTEAARRWMARRDEGAH